MPAIEQWSIIPATASNWRHQLHGSGWTRPLKVDRDIDLETIDVGKVMSAIDGARKLPSRHSRSCTTIPSASQMKRTVATRSLGRGLAQIEPTSGTLIVYAAKRGETALDGNGRDTPFVESYLH